jgi:hypothetical protein
VAKHRAAGVLVVCSLVFTFFTAVPWLWVSAASAKPNPKRQADQAIAKGSVLVIGDFPSGWRTQRSSNKAGDEARAQTPECKDYVRAQKKARSNPHVTAPGFAQGDSMYVDNSVFVFADEQAAKTAAQTVTGNEFKACLSKSTKKVLEARLNKRGVKFDDVKVDVGDLSADQAGDATTAQQAVVTVTQGSSSTTLYIDLEVVRVGRAVTTFSFQNSFTPFPDLKTALIDAVVNRLGQALGSGLPASPATSARPLGSAANLPGGKVTVYTYEQPATGISQYVTPQTPGSEFSAVDAEVCATGTGGLYGQPSDFALQFPDNTERQSSYGKQPDLSGRQLGAGDCARGWVTFEVPAGQRPSVVTYRVQSSSGGTPPPIEWTAQ